MWRVSKRVSVALVVLLGPRVRTASPQRVLVVLVGLMGPRAPPTFPVVLLGPRGLGGNRADNLARRMRSNPCPTTLRLNRLEMGPLVLRGLEAAAETDRPHPETKTATAIVLGIGTAIGTGIVTAIVIVTVIVTGIVIGAETVEIATATVLPLRNGGAT